MNTFVYTFNLFILFFAVFVMSSYVILAIISAFALKKYKLENKLINYNYILSYEHAPRISLIAPAYNEGMTIEENVSSLLAINYTKFEVIVVNDGSKDNTMETLIEAYDLVPSDRPYQMKINTKDVKCIYKSTNPSFSKLLVVDKVNGGKADALNVGVNISNNDYVVCIDVDCVMDKDSMLKLVKPFLDKEGKRVIATGGVVRIANSCVIQQGRLKSIEAPSNWLPRIQVVEYLRAFILGRMAWAKLDGLLLISGAFGMFDRDIVIKAGGYDHKTVGEDMELVVRMRRYMVDNKLPYTVQFIPDPLCWTEAPETRNVFMRQRSRWTRGTMETLWIHRKMMLNPRYRLLGLLSFPYWLIFEYLAPIIEFTGILITLVFIYFGYINWIYFLLLCLFVYTFSVCFSICAILADEFSYQQYKTLKDARKLIWAAFVDPLIFHPLTVIAALKGNWQKIRGNTQWGDMTRVGFAKTAPKK